VNPAFDPPVFYVSVLVSDRLVVKAQIAVEKQREESTVELKEYMLWNDCNRNGMWVQSFFWIRNINFFGIPRCLTPVTKDKDFIKEI